MKWDDHVSTANLDVSVIMPARDAAATIERSLAALRAQEGDVSFEVIVVDDGSSDGTAELAESEPGLRVLRQSGAGPAAARNRAAEIARGAALAFTDADCFPEPGWLAAGLNALERADLVQGAVAPEPVDRPHPFVRSLWVGRESGLYETANLFVHRELFDALGGFEAWLKPEIGKELAEDVWFGWRARRAGALTAFSREARVRHAVFALSAGDWIADRRRLRYFPGIAAKVPELRETMFFARIFLSRHSAAFDAAVGAVAWAALARSPVPLLGAAPYAYLLARRSRRWRRRAPWVAAMHVARDAVALAALVRGSVRWRSLVL